MATEIIFWIAAGLLVYSYFIYPLFMLMAGNWSKHKEYSTYSTPDLPRVSILMSVFNEEIVIREKVEAVMNMNYPAEKLEFLVGSDNSDDSTGKILEELEGKYSSLIVKLYGSRRGKPSVINDLVKESTGEILIITDADIIPQNDALINIVSPFTDPNVGLVDSTSVFRDQGARMTNMYEMTYQFIEARLKRSEGKLSGCMMGPAGGFYAVRRKIFKEIPPNFLADDFYICMNVMVEGSKAIIVDNARVDARIFTGLWEEYRRKVRIASGNWQNMFHYKTWLVRPWKRLSLRLISHKVIRWTGPHLYIALFIANGLLINHSLLYRVLFLVQLIFILLSALDLLLKYLKVNLVPLRFITHFYLMNLALLEGSIRFARGIRSGIWDPTKRVN